MLKVVINGRYYKENHRYGPTWSARQKKDCVYFYDYDEYTGYIIDHMDYKDLQKLRLNIYNQYHKYIKFTPFSEINNNGEKFTGYKLESPIIELNNTDFAKLIPNSSVRKLYYIWDSVREKYFLKSDFINYLKFGQCLSM